MSAKRNYNWSYPAVLLVLTSTLAVSGLASLRRPDHLGKPLETISGRIAGWRMAQVLTLDKRTTDNLSATSYVSRTYAKDGAMLDLFVSYYAQQRAGDNMHSPKNCLPGSGWEIWKYDSALVPFQGGTVRINKYSIQNAGERLLVFYWYQSKDRVFASEYLGKLLLVRDSLLSGHTSGSLVRLILPDTPGATAQAVQFASQLLPQVQECLGK